LEAGFGSNGTPHGSIEGIRQENASLLCKSKGWKVAATMQNPDEAASWTRAADLFTPKLDVADRASMKAAIAQTIDKFGRIA
jgi:NAD(P)-dependent dehydrogenase (short-subunit alcohol dehydrogenase family)